MGKPLSRPDCLRQNPRCLGKGEDEEAYIEDCYVPQRSIYDTMRINEQIDQGNKISQPSRSTLGSGGEGSTLSSNGTLGESVGGVFVARPTDAGAKKLDERVIFDALKLTGDPQSMSPVGGVSSGMHAGPSTSATSGAAAAVTKRRHQGTDKKDNPNRRSWKVFMPPSYPEFAERLEISAGEGAEKRLSGAGIPLSPLHPLPSIITPPPSQPYTLQTHTPPPTTSTPPLSSYAPSPVSLGGPHTPPASGSPSSSPAISPLPLHPLRQRQPPQLYSPQQKLPKPQSPLASPARDQRPLLASGFPKSQQGSSGSPHGSPCASREAGRRPVAASALVRKSASEEQPENWDVASAKASDSERDSPLLEDQDTVPLIAPLISPKPVFCPPTKARTWPRSMRGGKRGHLGRLHLLPPLPPLLGEDSDLDEESLYLLDPPSPFLQEGEGACYGGLPLSPCVSQEGGEEGLLGWTPSGALRERTASELRFEEDEMRILQEMEEEEEEEIAELERETEERIEEGENKGEKEELEEEERRQMEERDWEAVLKMESKVVVEPCWDGGLDEPQLQDWESQQLNSSGHWPLLTPPTEFGGAEPPSASPCPSSGSAESDDLFLELERQCLEEDDIEVSTETDSGAGLYSAPSERIRTLPRVEEAAEGEEQSVAETVNRETVNSEPFEQADLMQHTDPEHTDISEAHSDTDLSLPLQEGCCEQSQTETATENGQPQQPAHCLQVHRVAEVRDEEEYVEHTEDQEHSCSPSADTNSLVGLVPESDSSGIHESHPDRTALSDTAHTDLELADGKTDPEPDSGASSDPEQEGEAEDQKEGRDSSSKAPLSCCLPGPESSYCEGTGSENTCTEETGPEGTYTEVTGSNLLYSEDTGRADSFQSERPCTEAPEGPEDSNPEEEEDVQQAVASESSPEPTEMEEEEVKEKLGDVEFFSQEELVSSESTDGSAGMASESEAVSEPDGTPESEEASSETATRAQDESTSAGGVCADDETSGYELDITHPEPGTMSTPKSDVAQSSRAESHSVHTESTPPSPSPTYPSKPHELSSSHDSKDVDAFVTSDSFVYLAVAVPPQYSQDGPPSPLQDCIAPSPLPKPAPDSEESAFMSSDSFVYLAAPERLATVTDGGSACEDVCNLDSESEGSQSGVDFVLGSMTGDSDWESEGSGLDPVTSASRDQWESLEFGCLQGLFGEVNLDTVSFTSADDQDANSTPEPQVSKEVL